MRNLLLLSASIFIVSACVKDEPIESQKVIDVDGNVYNTITIGNQVWMTENLKVTRFDNGVLANSMTPANNSDYINNYGRLYNWETALKVCPKGWHLPSDYEWFVLLNYLDKTITAPDSTGFLGERTGAVLKSSKLWLESSYSTTNSTGFSALPSGYFQNGNFISIGLTTNFWSSTEGNDGQAFGGINFTYNSASVFRGYMNKQDGHCVRCLKDQ